MRSDAAAKAQGCRRIETGGHRRRRSAHYAAMPRVSDAVLQDLRMRYRAAHAAYQNCVRLVTEATMSGTLVSPTLLEQEAKALAILTKTRASLLAAMADDVGNEGPLGNPPR